MGDAVMDGFSDRGSTPLRSIQMEGKKTAEIPYLCNVINLVTMTRNTDFGSSLDFVFITSKVLFYYLMS